MPVNDRIQLRRGTEAQWIAAEAADVDDEPLANGEPGLVVDADGVALYLVIGDTDTEFGDLPRFSPTDALPAALSGAFLPFDATEVSVTAAATLTSSAFGKMHVCSGTTADYTVGLPAVAGNAGKVIHFRMAAGLTKLVTLDGDGAETIDGSASRIMWAGETATLFCDGTAWTKLWGKSIPMRATILRAAAQAVANATIVAIAYDTATVDYPTGMADVANNRVVIRRPGEYLLGGQTGIDQLSGNATRVITQIQVDGTAARQIEGSLTVGSFPALALPAVRLTLAAGALLTTIFFQDSGASRNTGTGVNDRPTFDVTELPTW